MCTASVFGPLQVLRVSATWRLACNLLILAITLLIAFARYMTIGKGLSNSLILGNAP